MCIYCSADSNEIFIQKGVVEMIYYIIMGFWSLRFLLKWEYVKNYKYFIIIIARGIAFNFIVYLYWLLSI